MKIKRIRKEIYVFILMMLLLNLGLFIKLNDSIINTIYGLTMLCDILVLKERYEL